MTEHWQIRPRFIVEEIDPPFVQINYYGKVSVLELPKEIDIFENLIEFLRAPRTRSDIYEKFDESNSEAVLSILKSHGFVFSCGPLENHINHTNSAPSSIHHFLSEFYSTETNATTVFEILKNKKIDIVNLTNHKMNFADSFNSIGLNFREKEVARAQTDCKNESDLNLIFSNWSDRFKINSYIKQCLNAHTSLLVILIESFGGTISPVFESSLRPCFDCLCMRKNANEAQINLELKFQNLVWQKKLELTTEINPFFTDMLVHFAAIKAFKFLSGIELESSLDEACDFNFLSMEITRSKILPIPSCRICAMSEAGA